LSKQIFKENFAEDEESAGMCGCRILKIRDDAPLKKFASTK
jgi:hypothetical protein